MYDLGRYISGFLITVATFVVVIILFDVSPAAAAVVGGLMGLIGGCLSAEWASRW